jgi:hypothetical protein
MTCPNCGVDPCACDYALTLFPGCRNEHLADTARYRVQEPLPHVGGCPCLICYAERAAVWAAWVQDR